MRQCLLAMLIANATDLGTRNRGCFGLRHLMYAVISDQDVAAWGDHPGKPQRRGFDNGGKSNIARRLQKEAINTNRSNLCCHQC